MKAIIIMPSSYDFSPFLEWAESNHLTDTNIVRRGIVLR